MTGLKKKFIGWLFMMQWSNLAKCCLFLQKVYSGVNSILPCMGVAALGIQWYRSSHPDPRKNSTTTIWPHHWSDSASQLRSRIVRWCQIKRIILCRVINHSKDTVTHGSHCNHIIVRKSVVLVKQDFLRQVSRPLWNLSSTTFQSPE